MKMKLTEQLARAAATDAGNRSMKEAGRTKWNEDDYNAAVREFERLWPAQYVDYKGDNVPDLPAIAATTYGFFI